MRAGRTGSGLLGLQARLLAARAEGRREFGAFPAVVSEGVRTQPPSRSNTTHCPGGLYAVLPTHSVLRGCPACALGHPVRGRSQGSRAEPSAVAAGHVQRRYRRRRPCLMRSAPHRTKLLGVGGAGGAHHVDWAGQRAIKLLISFFCSFFLSLFISLSCCICVLHLALSLYVSLCGACSWMISLVL